MSTLSVSIPSGTIGRTSSCIRSPGGSGGCSDEGSECDGLRTDELIEASTSAFLAVAAEAHATEGSVRLDRCGAVCPHGACVETFSDTVHATRICGLQPSRESVFGAVRYRYRFVF